MTPANLSESAGTGPAPEEVASLFYLVSNSRLADQLEIVETHQQRIASSMTIGSVVLPLTAAVLTSDNAEFDGQGWQAIVLIGAVSFYVGLVASFYLASRVSNWDTRPEMNQWREIATSDRNVFELQNWLGDACSQAFIHNSVLLQRKSDWVARGTLCLTLEVLCLSIAVLLPLISRWT